jgi:hypothetical protein
MSAANPRQPLPPEIAAPAEEAARPEADDSEAVIAATRRWVERAVIGLNLCPFAKSVQVSGRIRYVVSQALSADALLADLGRELQALRAADAQEVETTLLIHPHVLGDFLDYNDFLDIADAAVEALDLIDEIQVASFHPHYQFADTETEDITNYTNRSPFPTLHLLRQASVDKAVEAFPEAEAIFGTNVETLRKLGPAGWARLFAD